MKTLRNVLIMELLVCLVSVSGCTKSNIVSPEIPAEIETQKGAPDMYVISDNIDQEWLHDEVYDILTNENEYPMADELYFDLDTDAEKLYVDIIVKDDTTFKEVSFYADQVLKVINDIVVLQNLDYEVSGDLYFGGLFDTITTYLRIFKASEYQEGEGTPLVKDIIKPGSYVTYEMDE